jgi:nucleolar protein 56
MQTFLEGNINSKKSAKTPLGVIEPTLATVIQENLSITCRSDETIKELVRAVRAHFTKFIKLLAHGNLEQAQLGLGHSYSRSKVSRLKYSAYYYGVTTSVTESRGPQQL